MMNMPRPGGCWDFTSIVTARTKRRAIAGDMMRMAAVIRKAVRRSSTTRMGML